MLSQAIPRANEIAEALNGRRINADLRSRLCAACYAVSQQHYNSILILLAHPTASSYGLCTSQTTDRVDHERALAFTCSQR